VEVEVDVDGNGDGDAATPALKSEVDVIARESGERKRKWAARGYAQDEMEEMERRATAWVLHLHLPCFRPAVSILLLIEVDSDWDWYTTPL
jgi:hypothetical protein